MGFKSSLSSSRVLKRFISEIYPHPRPVHGFQVFARIEPCSKRFICDVCLVLCYKCSESLGHATAASSSRAR
jgi:hypothetical protein